MKTHTEHQKETEKRCREIRGAAWRAEKTRYNSATSTDRSGAGADWFFCFSVPFPFLIVVERNRRRLPSFAAGSPNAFRSAYLVLPSSYLVSYGIT